MKCPRYSLATFLVFASLQLWAVGQQQTTQSAVVVPPLVNYSGKATDAQGEPIAGIAGITFSIYKEQYDAAPLWMET